MHHLEGNASPAGDDGRGKGRREGMKDGRGKGPTSNGKGGKRRGGRERG